MLLYSQKWLYCLWFFCCANTCAFNICSMWCIIQALFLFYFYINLIVFLLLQRLISVWVSVVRRGCRQCCLVTFLSLSSVSCSASCWYTAAGHTCACASSCATSSIRTSPYLCALLVRIFLRLFCSGEPSAAELFFSCIYPCEDFT